MDWITIKIPKHLDRIVSDIMKIEKEKDIPRWDKKQNFYADSIKEKIKRVRDGKQKEA